MALTHHWSTMMRFAFLQMHQTNDSQLFLPGMFQQMHQSGVTAVQRLEKCFQVLLFILSLYSIDSNMYRSDFCFNSAQLLGCSIRIWCGRLSWCWRLGWYVIDAGLGNFIYAYFWCAGHWDYFRGTRLLVTCLLVFSDLSTVEKRSLQVACTLTL